MDVERPSYRPTPTGQHWSLPPVLCDQGHLWRNGMRPKVTFGAAKAPGVRMVEPASPLLGRPRNLGTMTRRLVLNAGRGQLS